MSNLVIVALPEEDDLVWKVSSEKVPHMTLLFLGESPSDVTGIARILGFVEHAASMQPPFWLDVDYRDKLGEDEADVLFFDPNSWDMKDIKNFRSSLLQNDLIKKAYDSVEQFPEWQPHLTLGYPATPAKPIPDDRKIYSVRFDRISVWTGDFEGPEFRLKHPVSMEVAMSSINEARIKLGFDALSHHGIKGMKWGVRRKNPGTPQEVTVKVDPTKVRKRISTSGGKGLPVHPDAVNARIGQQKLKKSGLDALSNKELQDLQTRLNLESNVARLNKDQVSRGEHAVVRFLKDPAGRRKIKDVADSGPGKAGKAAVGRVVKKKAATALATAAIIA